MTPTFAADLALKGEREAAAEDARIAGLLKEVVRLAGGLEEVAYSSGVWTTVAASAAVTAGSVLYLAGSGCGWRVLHCAGSLVDSEAGRWAAGVFAGSLVTTLSLATWAAFVNMYRL